MGWAYFGGGMLKFGKSRFTLHDDDMATSDHLSFLFRFTSSTKEQEESHLAPTTVVEYCIILQPKPSALLYQ